MENGQSQMILLMVGIVVGFVFGAGLAWWLTSRQRSSPSDPGEDRLAQLNQRYVEQVSLWHEKGSGKLVLRSGGKMLANPQQLNEAQRKTFNALMKEWLLWLGFPGAQPVPQPPPSPAQAVVAPSASIEEARISEAIQPPAAPAQAPALVIPAQANPVPEAARSIVEQIDAILQEKMKRHPAFHKGVRLVEDRREGVVVWVGLEHFNGLDAVTDPEVKAILRESVQEWERLNQPGKK